ncbi:Phototropic-responsive NPH3 family protein isoform 1 [Theobroma cacao]|uniref:Phototropic-responsive NPH3 family protein isoform 1 n=1 Tax=Theobroma cacao TaxID=3641 RepID=A0A061GQC1_THECC|nr:Phototropic-responsive NPH3 family protein isoform 1 [Theobroma cacao]
MKFMKLGSKPDAFQADGKCIRYVTSDLATDVTITVGEVKFYLHKFPLLSKSNRLQKLVLKASEENCDEINMVDFPGGPKAFEICSKFCYGMTVTLNAYNVVAARCAAEYLEMTEDVDRGNLIFKIEVFLNSSIFRSWKDSIIVLQTTKSLIPWSENLKIVGRCIDSIASKTSVDPANITWSYTYNRKLSVPDKIVDDGMKFREKVESVPKDWWVEDICELEIDLYKRVMTAVKSKGRMDGAVIGEALKTYAVRWLPDSVNALVSDAHSWRNKLLVETIVCLLPSDKAVGCSCGFLLKLLKVAILVGVDDSAKEDLVKRISLKLHEASVKDLLIPARSPQTTLYDVEMVQSIVNRYIMNEKRTQDLDVEKNEMGCADFVLGHGSLLSVGKLIDGYLEEIARDPNLSLARLIDLSQSIPECARPVHDGLYKAIDMYLKECIGKREMLIGREGRIVVSPTQVELGPCNMEHPSLTKAERKKLCGLMDVKKFTMDASMHAAQNERLPLRVVVQVLFFEQVRAAAGVQSLANNPRDISHSTTNTDEEWEKTAAEDCNSLKKQMSQMKVKEDGFQKNGKLAKKNSKNSKSGMQLLPSRSRRIFDKLWVVGKGHTENRSSETSGSSQSPTSMVPGDTKSSGSSSRHRRHSIS